MADFKDQMLASLIEDNRSLRREVVDILLSIAILRERHFELSEAAGSKGAASPKSRRAAARRPKARARTKLKRRDR